MEFTCVACGRRFNIFEEADRFVTLADSIGLNIDYYDDADCYDDPKDAVLCADCKFERARDLFSSDLEDAEYASFEYEDDDMPEGCKACDNPGYPMCKDSCPLFDD